MSTQPGYAASDSDPEVDEDSTLVHDQPPPELGAAGNSQAGLLTAAASDRCANCGAQLAPDQRYCVVCGERRGHARFASAMFGAQAVPEPEPAVLPVGGAVRTSRYPPAATLIAGIAVLLVAMGLGILIGHDSSPNKTLTPQPKVNVTVNGGSGGSAGSSTGASTRATRTTPTSKSSTKAAKATAAATAPKLTPKQQQQAAAAGAKAAGGSASNAPPPGTQVGGACSHGAGCQGGKFTGNFFGG